MPGPLTLQRILDAIDAGSESAIYVHGLVTTPQASAAIRSGIRRGWSPRELLRILREQRSNSKWISRPIDQRAFLARPSTTGTGAGTHFSPEPPRRWPHRAIALRPTGLMVSGSRTSASVPTHPSPSA